MSNVIASAETLCPRLKFTQIGKEVKFPRLWPRAWTGPVAHRVVLCSFLCVCVCVCVGLMSVLEQASVKSIAVIPKSESKYLTLVAITSSALRLYFSALSLSVRPPPKTMRRSHSLPRLLTYNCPHSLY
jgi:hypothetical protein